MLEERKARQKIAAAAARRPTDALALASPGSASHSIGARRPNPQMRHGLNSLSGDYIRGLQRV